MSFLSTLSLRRATYFSGVMRQNPGISIHALLAESDRGWTLNINGPMNFYPRSPCGERPASHLSKFNTSHFYPRSPCGERHTKKKNQPGKSNISIHALLAESDVVDTVKLADTMLFLSTLSLRRATSGRPETRRSCAISIHALLAESDAPPLI